MDVSKKLLTVHEASVALGLGRSFVYTLVATGQLKSIKLGRARRIPIGEIDEFILRRLEQEATGIEAR